MIWLHATKTRCSKITVLSADTDVYMIGLPLQCSLDKDIIVQVSNINSRERKLLSLKNMIVAIQNDPDLATVTEATRLKVIQALFVVTGCDCVSFFSGMGKATFLRYFFQHAEYITGYTKGSLSHTLLCNSGYEEGRDLWPFLDCWHSLLPQKCNSICIWHTRITLQKLHEFLRYWEAARRLASGHTAKYVGQNNLWKPNDSIYEFLVAPLETLMLGLRHVEKLRSKHNDGGWAN